jgi:hypothetical protein
MQAALYHVARLTGSAPSSPDATHEAWRATEVAQVATFRPEGSHHRPHTSVRLLHDDHAIHGLFTVEDRFVRSVHEGFQAPVWKDSCVEFFVRPRGHGGYFNFEMNAGGSLLSTYIVNWERVPGGFKEFTQLPDSDLAQVTVCSTLPRRVEPELPGPLAWSLYVRIPVSMLERHTGPLGPLAGQTWTGNFFKCGDETSHPHWASWSPVRALNFHDPHCFGRLVFA